MKTNQLNRHLGKLAIGLSSATLLAFFSQQANADTYTVQYGDSFYAIATKYGMSPYDLAAKNGKTIYDTILPGDVLQVNGARANTYQVSNQATTAQATNANSGADSDTENVVLNTPTATGNSYPIGQCTWGVKSLAPWFWY